MSDCNANRITEYLSGTLSTEAMTDVETHLAQCEDCRQHLDREAAPANAWRDAKSMLVDDSLDGPSSSVSTRVMADTSLPFDELVEEASGDGGAVNAAMVTREISGWLDPTDDPTMLGRFAGYEIVGVVGHGEMGIVLKGFEPSLNRFVAIKAMAPRLASSEAARKRFAREAQATAAVLHENVVAIHRVDKTHGLPFLVMPYLGGESLQRRIDNSGPLGIEASLQVATQIAAGLAAAHARGLIHRDIKPANILLPHGVQRVTITDFGLARAADETSVTRTGIIAGTPPYMSPEQARGQQLDARSDLFSLGSVLYTMLTAELPFRGETNHEIVHRVATERAESLSAIDESIPAWVSELVDWLHEKSPEARPGSAAQVQHVIDACLLHLQDPDSPLPQPLVKDSVTSRAQSALKWIVASVAAVVVLVIAIILGPTLNRPNVGSPSVGTGSNDNSSKPSLPTDVEWNELTAESFDQDMLEIESEISELERKLSEEEGI